MALGLNLLSSVLTKTSSVAQLSNAIDLGLTAGATSVTVGETAALITLPTSPTGQPLVQIMTADGSAANGGRPPLNPTAIGGGSDDEFMVMGAGHDNLYGGAGADTLHGGDGNDHLYGYAPMAGPDGGDLILGGAGNDYIQGNAGADTLDGGTGSDRIYGGADADMIFGGEGHDAMNGNFGNDTISGDAGNDVLHGGKGDDMILGGEGHDILFGDLGADTIAGGAGTDLFRYGGNDASLVDTDLLFGRLETIADFEDGQDHVALSFRPIEIARGIAEGGLLDALAVARTVLTGANGGHGVAAVQVGDDTILFYGTANGLVPDSAVRLAGMTAAQVTIDDFI